MQAVKEVERREDLRCRFADAEHYHLSQGRMVGRMGGKLAQLLYGAEIVKAVSKGAQGLGWVAKAGQAVEQLGEAAATAQKGKAVVRVVQAEQQAVVTGTQAAQAAEKVGEAAKAGKFTVQFGKDSNQINHTFRHTDILGLNRAVVKSAIEAHFTSASSQIAPGKPFNQVIEVAGKRIQYTAFKLKDGTINIGRIHGVG
ncbi:MAG: hypothetical protein AAF400_00830 [Bacteroidota bacterium]